MITLEYHCYQNEAKYQKLQRLDESVDLENNLINNKTGKKVSNWLQTEMYHKNHGPHPMSIFDRDGISNYVSTNKDILHEQREGNDKQFMIVKDDMLNDHYTDEIHRN